MTTQTRRNTCVLLKRRHLHTKRWFSETSRQVHLPRKQCLINRDSHQHVTSKDMDSQRLIIGHTRPIKWSADFFSRTVVLSIFLYGYTSWTLPKRMEKKLDGNYTRMLWAISNKSRRQHPTKQQLHGHLQPITKTIEVRQTRNAGNCWRSRDELINGILLWTPSHGRAKEERPARTYIQQLCVDTGCCLDNLLGAIDDREGWSLTWWWWWWW